MGGTNQLDHLALVGWRAIGRAHAHAAEAKSRDFESAFSQCALLHVVSLPGSFAHPTLGANDHETVARSCLLIAYFSCQARNQWRNAAPKVTIFRKRREQVVTMKNTKENAVLRVKPGPRSCAQNSRARLPL